MILRELASKFDASLCESLSVLMNRTPEQREYIENVRSTEHLECPMGVTESPYSMDATRMGIVLAFQVESIEIETPVLSRCASTPALNSDSALPLEKGESTPILDLSQYPVRSSGQGVMNESVQHVVVTEIVQQVVVNESSQRVVGNEQPKSTETPESLERIGIFRSSLPGKPVESTRSSEAIESTRSTESNQSMQPIGSTQSMQPIGSTQSMQPIGSTQPVQPTQPTESTHTLPSPQSSPATPSKPLKRASSQAPILPSIPLFFSQEPVVVPTLDDSNSEEKKSRLSLPSDLVRLASPSHP